jgi:hypothetical protein
LQIIKKQVVLVRVGSAQRLCAAVLCTVKGIGVIKAITFPEAANGEENAQGEQVSGRKTVDGPGIVQKALHSVLDCLTFWNSRCRRVSKMNSKCMESYQESYAGNSDDKRKKANN